MFSRTPKKPTRKSTTATGVLLPPPPKPVDLFQREEAEPEPEVRTFKQPPSNLEKVTEFMEWGSPINQCFVMEAVGRYAAQCVAQEEQLITSMRNGLISGERWVQSAKDWLAKNPR